jgi:hypothetical protein
VTAPSNGAARRERRLPKHPFRDSAILYAALAAIVVAVSVATGGSVARAAAIAAGFFVAATGWSWWRFKVKLDADRRKR